MAAAASTTWSSTTSKEVDSQFFDDLLRLELADCDREPFRQMGMFTQVVNTPG